MLYVSKRTQKRYRAFNTLVFYMMHNRIYYKEAYVQEFMRKDLDDNKKMGSKIEV